MPGDRERAAADRAMTLRVDGPTWDALVNVAGRAGIVMPAAVPEQSKTIE
jgi:hypothetical protein